MDYSQLGSEAQIDKTKKSLEANGINVIVVKNGEEAKKKVQEIIPKGAEVMTMTSITLETTGIAKEINESGAYNAVRSRLMKMDRKTQGDEMQKLGAAPEWAIGSVHAVAEDGTIMIASATGSQVPTNEYGSRHVICVEGVHRLVKDMDDGMKRIYTYTLPLESERAKKAYGAPGSSVNKLLIIKKEVQPERMTMIIVNEMLGY